MIIYRLKIEILNLNISKSPVKTDMAEIYPVL